VSRHLPYIAVAAAAAAVSWACACRSGTRDDAPPCSAVAARFLDLARHDIAGAKLDDATAHAVADQLPAMRDSLAQICSDGKWSAQVRRCLVLTSDRAGFETCQQQLTDEQRRELDRASRGTGPSP